MSNPFDNPVVHATLDRATNTVPTAPSAPPAPSGGLRSLDDAVNRQGAPSLFTKYSKVGDTGGGPILSAEIQQRRDFTTGTPLTWDDGNAQEQVVIRVQTDLRDPAKPDDDGVRGIYVKTWGPQLRALQDAISQAGFSSASEALAPGNSFYGKLTGEQPPPVRGGDPEKLYAYIVQPGSGAAATPAPASPVAPSPAAMPPAQPQAQPPF